MVHPHLSTSLQIVSASLSILCLGAAISSPFIPHLSSVTSIALPVVLASGSTLSGVAFLALTLNKHRHSLSHSDPLFALISKLRSTEVTPDDAVKFEQLLEKLPHIDWPLATLSKESPLLLLSKLGRPIEFLDLLVQRGADFNVQDTWFGNTPLMWAIANAANEMALAILNKGDTNLDIRDSERGNTALTLAIVKGYIDEDKEGNHFTVSNLELVKTLLEKRANPNVKTYDGISPLQLAIVRRNPEMVDALLKNGAKIDFDWEPLLDLSYREAKVELKKQVKPLLLDRTIFEESKEKVRHLLTSALR